MSLMVAPAGSVLGPTLKCSSPTLSVAALAVSTVSVPWFWSTSARIDPGVPVRDHGQRRRRRRGGVAMPPTCPAAAQAVAAQVPDHRVDDAVSRVTLVDGLTAVVGARGHVGGAGRDGVDHGGAGRAARRWDSGGLWCRSGSHPATAEALSTALVSAVTKGKSAVVYPSHLRFSLRSLAQPAETELSSSAWSTTASQPRNSPICGAHRGTRDKREADRIKAVILLASGWSAADVADALLIDPNSVRNHFKRYQQGGLEGLLHVAYRGSD